MHYDAIIRTFNSEKTLEEVLNSLNEQTIRPSKTIVIDSGSTDSTLAIAAAHGCQIEYYTGTSFNYSRSLNQALQHVNEKRFLVLSSHTIITNKQLLERMNSFLSLEYPVVSVCRNYVPNSVKKISKDTFDGFNGIWNCCALYRTKLAKKIAFNERVPTSEDQYFAKTIYLQGLKTVAIEGPHVLHKNHRYSLKKQRNEYVSIAYFTHRKLMSPQGILKLVKEGTLAILNKKPKWIIAYHKVTIAGRLIKAYVSEPRFASRYFKDST